MPFEVGFFGENLPFMCGWEFYFESVESSLVLKKDDNSTTLLHYLLDLTTNLSMIKLTSVFDLNISCIIEYKFRLTINGWRNCDFFNIEEISRELLLIGSHIFQCASNSQDKRILLRYLCKGETTYIDNDWEILIHDFLRNILLLPFLNIGECCFISLHSIERYAI